MKVLNNLKYILLVAICFGCEQFITEESTSQIVNEIVLTSPADANSMVLGVYEDGLQDGDSYGEAEVGTMAVLGDELVHTGSFPSVAEMDINNIASQNGEVLGYWDAMYEGIFLANFLLENIGDIPFSDEALRNQYIAEVRWCRALYHFNLVRLFGAIPLATTSDLDALSSIPRTSEAEVIQYVIAELTEVATALNGVTYASAAEEKSRATEWAAKALLARVYLWNGDLTQAGNFADDVITNGGFSLESNYLDIFAGGSEETIFEVFFDPNDGNGLAFFFQEDGRFEYGPSPQLTAAFEDGDSRSAIIGETSGGQAMGLKYTDVANGSDKPIVLRLAEMHLIRAEARLGTEQSLADVNAIRARAGLAALTTVTLDDILQERFVELAFEGHRWFDLKRTGRLDAVMSAINPGTWQSTDALMPIPQNDLNLNTNLTQNPGY